MTVVASRMIRNVAAVIPMVALLACGGADEASDDMAGHQGQAVSAESEELTALRALAVPFADIEAARTAGYTAQITPCWYHREQGGQGLHFARSEWIDGNITLLEPELTMYEPQADGSLQFVAVEYIVPFAQWTQAEAPQLLGQSFMRNEQLELWVLHVWLGKDNPTGLYASWNPNVTCSHAETSEDRAI